MATAPDPYALIAHFYEAEYGHLETDVGFFARRAGSGRLLVLGCGTGRISRRLAPTRPVVGLDLSAPMLELARGLAPAAESVQGDMRSFDLGLFGEIIVPNAAFSFLPTRADQAACLGACHAALRPGAPLTLDLPMPDFGQWAQAVSPETTVWEGEVQGLPARRSRSTRRDPARQRLDITDRYFLDGVEVALSQLPLRLMLPGEVEWMLEASGFYVDELLGDYAGGPIRAGCPRLLARAVRI